MAFNYFIDSHCHLHDQQFFGAKAQPELLKRAVDQNVKKLIVIGTDPEDSLNARDFASKNSSLDQQIYWSYGVHPDEVSKFHTAPDFKSQLPLAIGEVGLDYHHNTDNKAEQFALLEAMIKLAETYDLPLIFHVREAFDDFFEIVDRHPNLRGVVHNFTDNKKNLKRALDRGFYIGVNGLATYSTLPLPPLDRILLETDAPFLAPVPHRGEQNESSYIPCVATWLAEKLNLPVEAIMEETTKNCYDLFRFND